MNIFQNLFAVFNALILSLISLAHPTQKLDNFTIASSSVFQSDSATHLATTTKHEINTLTSSSSQSESVVVWSDEKSKYTFSNGHVYLNGVKIEGADSGSFQMVTQNPFPKGPYSGESIAHYSKDKNNVFYDGEIIKGADSLTFKVAWSDAIGSEHVYAKDVDNVYYMGKVLTPKADPGSFVVLGELKNGWRSAGSYGKDKNFVYYKNMEVIGADVDAFNSEYEDHYAVDKSHVFFEGKIIPNADPKKFSFPVYEQ